MTVLSVFVHIWWMGLFLFADNNNKRRNSLCVITFVFKEDAESLCCFNGIPCWLIFFVGRSCPLYYYYSFPFFKSIVWLLSNCVSMETKGRGSSLQENKQRRLKKSWQEKFEQKRSSFEKMSKSTFFFRRDLILGHKNKGPDKPRDKEWGNLLTACQVYWTGMQDKMLADATFTSSSHQFLFHREE